MEPGPPWACMAAPPCFTQMTEPIRLRSMVARTAATSAVSTEPRCSEPPAQANSPSMRPVASALRRHRRGDLLLDGDVGHDVAGRGAVGRGAASDALVRVDELLLGAPADRDVRAVGGEALGRGEPDAAPAAGDEDGPAGDAGRRAVRRHQTGPTPERRGGRERDGHLLDPGDEVGRPAGQRAALDGEAEVGQAGQQPLDHDLELQPGQLVAQAEVGAEAEGHVRVGAAGDVEGVGVVEDRLVAVGRRVEEEELLARPDRVRRPSSTSRVAVRAMFLIGDTQRSISSTAPGMSPAGSAASRASWSGWASSSSTPPLMTWRVVSSPPIRMSSVSWTSESSSSESPSISAWHSTPTRSSRVAAWPADRRRRGGCTRCTPTKACMAAYHGVGVGRALRP